MGIKLLNNVIVRFFVFIGVSVMFFVVDDVINFFFLGVGDWFFVVIVDVVVNCEIVKVIVRIGVVFFIMCV